VNPAAWRWAQHSLRMRWRGILVLTLLLAVAAGVGFTALVGARRSGAVVRETMDEHLQPDVMSLPSVPHVNWKPIVHLPYVESAGVFAATPLCLDETGGGLEGESGVLCTQPPVSGGWYKTIWRLDTLAGRLPTRPNEIAINKLAEQQYGWPIGKVLHLEGVYPDRLNDYWGGKPRGPKPWGPVFRVKITGIFAGEDAWRVISGGVGAPGFLCSRSFMPKYGHRIGYLTQAFIRLRDGEQDIPRLQADITRITGDPAFPIRNVAEAQRRVERSTRVEGGALEVFGAALLVGAGILLVLALVRLTEAGADEARTLRTLGMPRRSLVAALAVPGAVVGLAGSLGAIAVSVLTSDRVPIGIARTFDRHGGIKADPLVLVPGGLAILLASVAVSLLVARHIARDRGAQRTARGSRVGSVVSRLPLPAAAALGVRLAVDPKIGAGGKVRVGVAGAVVAVLAVVAAFTVRAGLQDTVGNPERVGKSWDLAFYSDLRPQVLVADDDVAGAALVKRASVDIHRSAVPLFGIAMIGRPLHMSLLSGRAPAAPDEIALGPSTADLLGLHVGDSAAAVAGARRTLHVVGIALLWEEGGHSAYDEGGWTTARGFQSLRPPEVQWTYYFIDVRDGVDPTAVRRHIEKAGGVFDPGWPAPAAVVNLRTARNLPSILGIVLACLGATGLAYALASTRRKKHDLALLRALGMPASGARAVLLWQAASIAIIGLIVGLPLGLLAGRLVWNSIADSMPVEYVAPFPLVPMLIVVPAALLVGLAVALWPARVDLRPAPASVLRTD
jgi:ABC-type lipoprotein release transport system permease subunit